MKEAIENHFKACELINEQLPVGEWTNEKHRYEFKHAGFNCLILRNSVMFVLCGYVGIPEGHPYYEKDYDKMDDINVHGGVTYSGDSHMHIRLEEDVGRELWWVGFDCCHWKDLMPATFLSAISFLRDKDDNFSTIYRNVDWVKKEVESLAEQLSLIK